MSALDINVHRTDEAEEPTVETGTDRGVRLSTVLDGYRFVDAVEIKAKTVAVHIDANHYDEDAVIGKLVRSFALEFTGKHHGKLHFRRTTQ